MYDVWWCDVVRVLNSILFFGHFRTTLRLIEVLEARSRASAIWIDDLWPNFAITFI